MVVFNKQRFDAESPDKTWLLPHGSLKPLKYTFS
jgi:hypothetical protein